MTGFKIALKNIRFKEDPTGRVRIYRVHQHVAGKNRRTEEAKTAKLEAKWKDKNNARD